jgi:hypothetical protein
MQRQGEAVRQQRQRQEALEMAMNEEYRKETKLETLTRDFFNSHPISGEDKPTLEQLGGMLRCRRLAVFTTLLCSVASSISYDLGC